MVYRDLWAAPLDVDIKSRMLTFWDGLCSEGGHKISNLLTWKKNFYLNG